MKEPRLIELFLTEDEARELLDPVGNGGHQQFHALLIAKLEGANLRADDQPRIRLSDEELGKVVRYMTQYGSGGFQSRLRRCLLRPLVNLLTGM